VARSVVVPTGRSGGARWARFKACGWWYNEGRRAGGKTEAQAGTGTGKGGGVAPVKVPRWASSPYVVNQEPVITVTNKWVIQGINANKAGYKPQGVGINKAVREIRGQMRPVNACVVRAMARPEVAVVGNKKYGQALLGRSKKAVLR